MAENGLEQHEEADLIYLLDEITEQSLRHRLEAKSNEQQEAADTNPGKKGVIYLGRIPHGFYEQQMRAYFSQFGQVTRLRMSRNKKTGRSKHYAFIEFSDVEVARIVAETMNNYLMYDHLLKSDHDQWIGQVIPEDQVHPRLWVGANRKFRVLPRKGMERERINAARSKEQWEALREKAKKKEIALRRKLDQLGIDYDFEGLFTKKHADNVPCTDDSTQPKLKKRKVTRKTTESK